MPSTDPIEIKFILNSSELKDGFTAIVSSLKNSNEAVEELKKRFEQLTAAQVLNVKGARDLGDAIKNIKITTDKTKVEDIVGLKEKIRDRRKDISDLESQLQSLNEWIGKSRSGKAKDSLAAEAEKVRIEIENEKTALRDLESAMDDHAQTGKRLSAQYRELRDEMRKLQLAGKGNSSEYQELSKRADEYHQAMKQVDSELKVAVSNDSFSGYVQGLSLVAGGFSAVQGAMGLLAGENENLQKIMLKVQSLMAITIGLQQIQEALDKRSAFSIQVLSKANNALARTNTRVATTLGISNTAAKALLGTMTLGLAVALPFIIKQFERWSKAQSNAGKVTGEAADDIAALTVKYKILQSQWSALGADAKKQAAFVKENQREFNDLGVAVTKVADAQKVLVDSSDEFIKALVNQAKAAAALELATDAIKTSLENQKKLRDSFSNYTGDNWLLREWDKLKQQADKFGDVTGLFRIFPNPEDAEKEGEDYMKIWEDFTKKADDIFEKLGIKKSSNGKTAEDEFLPPGSVAEIKKRISDIDKQLSKLGNNADNDVVEKLKATRLAAAEELAAAEKRIEIQNIQEAIDARQNAWQQYYQYEAEFGKEAAKKQFAALQGEASSYFDWLKQQKEGFESLVENGPLTEKQLADFKTVTDKLAELSGQKSDFDNFTNGIDRAIERAPLLADQLSVVNREIEKLADDNRNIDNGKLGFLFAKKEDIQGQLAAQAQEFIEAQETIEKKRNAIVEKYAAIREEINKRSDINESEKERLIQASKAVADAEIAEAERAESERNNVFLRYSKNIIAASREELKARIKSLEEFLKASEGILTAEERSFIESQIKQSKSVIALTDSRTRENALLLEKERILKKIENLQEGEEGDLPRLLRQLEAVNKELSKGEFTKKAEKVAEIAGFTGSQFREMANAIGDSNEGLSDTLEAMADVLGVVEDAATAAASFSSGDIAGGIASTIKGISGIFSIGSKARESRRKADAEIAKREKEVFQSGLDYNKILRDRLTLEMQITEETRGRIAAIREEIEANMTNFSSIMRDYDAVFKRLLKSETIVDQYTKKTGGFLGIGKKTKVVDVTNTLAELLGVGPNAQINDDIFDKLAKINAQKPLTGDAKTAYEQLLKLKDEYGSIEQLQSDLTKELKETLAGTTRESIANSIAEGLRQGKRSVADFSDDLNKMLENAIVSAFVNNSAINAGAKELQNVIADAMEDGVLSETEAEDIRSLYESLINQSTAIFDQINSVGIDFGGNKQSASNAYKGAYATASQESIDLLSGHTAGLRIAVVETNNINKAGFHDLMEAMSRSFQTQLDIERNTRRTATNTDNISKTNDKGFRGMKTAYEKNYNALRAAGIIR